MTVAPPMLYAGVPVEEQVMADERKRLNEAVSRLVWYIDFELMPPDGEPITYREVLRRLAEKRAELGVTREALVPFKDDDIWMDWQNEIGMAEDNKGLIENEVFWDLPVGFRCTDEYRPIVEAEEQWYEAHPDGTGAERDAVMREIVARYVPSDPST